MGPINFAPNSLVATIDVRIKRFEVSHRCDGISYHEVKIISIF